MSSLALSSVHTCHAAPINDQQMFTRNSDLLAVQTVAVGIDLSSKKSSFKSHRNVSKP